MTRERWIGLLFFLLGSGIFIFWGIALERTAGGSMGDFKAVYYGTGCLLQHHNPYKPSELEGVYREEGWKVPLDSLQNRQGATLYVNMPTTFIFIAPFAMLPWVPAHVLWMTLTGGSLIFAAYLMWDLGANYSPIFSGFLIGFLLANSEILFACGNTAGIVVSFCVIAVWCFLKERFIPAGILCLAVSLAIKPHDAGLVWLYFLLAGEGYRKRTLQTLAITVVLGLSAVLWVSQVAPHWMQDWHSNLLAISTHGGLNDPASTLVNGRDIINLQTVFSIFRDDPRIYNSVSYLVCGALLLVWLVRTLRSRFSQRNAWLALAAVAALTMLITYHRTHDAKLLLLTVPACAMLWAEGGLTGWLALLANIAGIVFTGDVAMAVLMIHTRNLHFSTVGLSGQILTLMLMRPATLILLVMGIFYLWVYLRRAGPETETAPSNDNSN